MTVAVIDYDLGNLPSVTKALERVGADVSVIDTPDGLDDATRVVLPGVGHFGAGVHNLNQRGFDVALREWIDDARPLLGICVGMQLLFERSEEDADARGLGVLPGEVKRIDAPTVPHMGWNTLDATRGTLDAVAAGEMVYFVHSYAALAPEEVTAATTTYHDTFASAVEADNVVGVQFHPEKSADVGRRFLERYLA